jgi:hypothetical protein
MQQKCLLGARVGRRSVYRHDIKLADCSYFREIINHNVQEISDNLKKTALTLWPWSWTFTI